MSSKCKSEKIVKILLVTHYYPAHRGGVEIVAGKLAEHLIQTNRVKIQWIASYVDPSPVGITGLITLPIVSSNLLENKIGIPYPIWSLPSFYKLWKILKEIDVIHLHDYLYMGNIAAFILAIIYQKPVVITQHIGFINYKNVLLRWLLSFLNKTLGIWILGRAGQTVFISEVVQKYFSYKNRLHHSSLMIPNGVDTSVFFPVEQQKRTRLRKELGLLIEKPLFLFVGRFVEKKGLPILQQLALRFQSVHWAFAGWGSVEIESWGLPNVTVFRDLRGSQLTPLYQAADLLVLPSKGEGFPLVVQEAMACGTPVMVGSETAQAYSAAKHLMFSEDVETLYTVDRWSSKIEELLKDPSILAAIRPQVAAFAQKHWSWQRCAEQYYQIFQELVERRK